MNHLYLQVLKRKTEGIIYAIMIYEDYNRPRLIRLVEYSWFFLTKKPLTMGIMQVRSNTYINDIESVRRGVDLVLQYYTEALQNLKRMILHMNVIIFCHCSSESITVELNIK